ncbi:MAG: SIR2 family protein [Pseudomonadales bacterium]
MAKVLVFTGAGASAPLGLPTTTQFTDEIFDNPKLVTELVKKYLGEKSGNDIERLLSTLEEFGDSSGFTGFLINNLPIFQFIYAGTNAVNSNQGNIISTLSRIISTHQEETKSEIQRIKSIVYRKLQAFDKSKAFQLYSSLIAELKNEIFDCRISYATANYDLTLDSALDDDEDLCKATGIIDAHYGFSLRRSRLVYDAQTEYDWPLDHIEYLKVHGSLDWHPDALRGLCVKSGSSVNPQNPDDMVILYPGFKGIPSKEPFISLHSKLEERLKSSELVIVIGFAFRDPYINSLFETAIKNNSHKKFILINPTPANEFPQDSIIGRLKTYSNFIHVQDKLQMSKTPLNLRLLLEEFAPEFTSETTLSE